MLLFFFCWAFIGVGDLGEMRFGVKGVEKQEVDKKGEDGGMAILHVYDQVVCFCSDEEKDRRA